MHKRTPLFQFLLLFISLTYLPFIAFAEATNVVIDAPVHGEKVGQNIAVVTDGIFAEEGAAWNVNEACTSQKDVSAFYQVDLNQSAIVKAIVLQADWNDSYIIEFQNSAGEWKKLWYAPTFGYEEGLRTRSIILDTPIQTGAFKIRGGYGDSILSVSEFQVYSEVPSNWDELTKKSLPGTRFSWFPFLTAGRIDKLRDLLLTFGIGLLVWLIAAPDRNPSLRSKLFGLAAVVSFILWANLFQFHYSSLVHRHEFFHYYLGSKYNKELSYSRIYDCGVIADSEDGFLKPGATRSVRNLLTNTVEPSSRITADPMACKKHFSVDQWANFKSDLSWFRKNMTLKDYERIYTDHGFNGTPVWSILGSLLSKVTSASTFQIYLLGLIDVIALAIAWFIFYRTFGIETTSIAMMFWGGNYIARFAWTGAGFLRADWLITAMLSVCALKTGRKFLGGMLGAYSGLARIFPLTLTAGVALASIWKSFSTKSIKPFLEHKDFFGGLIAASLGLVLVASLNAGSLSIWNDFFFNTAKHYNTSSTNMVGLRSAIAVSPTTFSDDIRDPMASDAFNDWQEVKDRVFEGRKIAYYIIFALTVLAVGLIGSKMEVWEAATLGFTLAALIRLSNYDYYFLMFFAVFLRRTPWVPLLLLTLGTISWKVPGAFGEDDKGYFAISVIVLLFLYSSLYILRKNGRCRNAQSTT